MKKEIETIKKELTELELETESRIKNIRAELDKFTQPDETKGFTGDAVCILNESGFSHGNIYTFINGRTKDDDGRIRPIPAARCPVESIDDEWFNQLFKATEKRPAVESDYPKPAPVRLWCAKDYSPGEWLTRGEIYCINKNIKGLRYDDGHVGFCDSFQNYCLLNPNKAKCLFPLVKRPAKEWEWVYISNKHNDLSHYPEDSIKNGGVYKIVKDDKTPERSLLTNTNTWLWNDEYEVIDGYKGEYENICPNCGAIMDEKEKEG